MSEKSDGGSQVLPKVLFLPIFHIPVAAVTWEPQLPATRLRAEAQQAECAEPREQDHCQDHLVWVGSHCASPPVEELLKELFNSATCAMEALACCDRCHVATSQVWTVTPLAKGVRQRFGSAFSPIHKLHRAQTHF